MTTSAQPESPETCQALRDRLQRPAPMVARKLIFSGVGPRDVYNIAAPFNLHGRTVIAGRVERREVEESEIVFFTEGRGVWEPVASAMTFPGLQDPCVTFIAGRLVLGGVRFPVKMADGATGWRMEFFHGSSLTDLTRFLVGPDRMKDIRLVALDDERVAVFTRPQGAKGGRGKIGFLVASSLATLTAELIQEAPLFERQCREDEWLGANEAHLLKNGHLGVLGHMAYFDEQEHRHYYPIVFVVNPATGRASSPEIIARRSDFPAGAAKRPDLADVIFSGGLVRHGNGTATLYAGLSDAEAGCVTLPDPFDKFETAPTR